MGGDLVGVAIFVGIAVAVGLGVFGWVWFWTIYRAACEVRDYYRRANADYLDGAD